MATYVISDIHGQYDMFMDLLNKISLKNTDILYVLGDIVDRGPYSIKTLQKLMQMPNVICVVGNHELMALDGLRFLSTEITEESVRSMNSQLLEQLADWQLNGGGPTMEEFRLLAIPMREQIIDFIMNFSVYEKLTVDGNKFLLVHAGLGNFDPIKDIEDYSLRDLIWNRTDYEKQYYPDVYVVTGHTPTQRIKENPTPGFIYRKNNHIAIDCGARIPGGRLAAICLDTGEEYYSYTNKGNGQNEFLYQ